MKISKIFKYSSIFLCLIGIILFTYFYVYNESPIYVFDYSGYFENFKMMGHLLRTDFKAFCETLFTSIRSFDYNYSSVIFLMPFFKIFGESRLSYIISLAVVYIFPCILLIVRSFNKIIIIEQNENQKMEIKYFIFTMLLAFMYTRLWSPTLRGLSDIIGMIPIIISFDMINKHSLINKQKSYYPILLGVIVYLPFLFRRWYIYYIISFCISSFLIDFYIFLFKKREKKIFWNAFKNYFLLGSTILVLALLIQLPLLKLILSQSYGEAYNGFQDNLLNHLINFYNEFGLLIILLSLFGIFFSFYRKKHLKNTLFCVFNVVIFWTFFGSVQAMGVHHYLGISFWMIILVMIGIRHIFEILPKYKYTFLSLILLLFAVNFSTTFIFRDKSIPFVSQNNKYYKLRYNNFGELKRLLKDSENLLQDPVGLSQNRKLSVLADSEVLSDNLIDLLGNVNIKDNIIYATHIDSRDGINFNSLLGKYVIVTSKIEVGVNPDGQHVLGIPNRMIYEGYAIGKAYKRISGPYYLDDGVEAYIYEKTRKFTQKEVLLYFESFYEKYPSWQKKYNYLDKILLESDIYMGSNCGAFKRMDDDTYFFYPGVDSTTVNIPIKKEIKKLKLKFYVDYNGNNPESGKVSVTIKSDKKIVFEEEISYSNERIVELNLEDTNNLIFIVDGGENLLDDWLLMDIMEIIM